MNNKGSVLFYSLMLGLTVIILALALAPAVGEFVDDARNDTIGMDCDNTSISDFDKAACIATDASSFYFVGSLILIGIALLGAKVIIG